MPYQWTSEENKRIYSQQVTEIIAGLRESLFNENKVHLAQGYNSIQTTSTPEKSNSDTIIARKNSDNKKKQAAEQNTEPVAKKEQIKPNDFMAEVESTLMRIRPGQTLTGKVVQITEDEVSVSIGYKADGLIKRSDLVDQDVKLDDEIEVEVVKVNDGEGNVLLSQRNIVNRKAWDALMEKYEAGEYVDAVGKEAVKGGLIANVDGIRAFVPASQLSQQYVEEIGDFVGKNMKLKIIEVDVQKKRIVASRKAVVAEEAAAKKKEALDRLEVGMVVHGIIRRLSDYGAFVELQGCITGLIHVSNLSWNNVKHPSEIVKIGQDVDVKIIALNREHERVELGYKQLQPKPVEQKEPLDVVFSEYNKSRESSITLNSREKLTLRDKTSNLIRETNEMLNKIFPLLCELQDMEDKLRTIQDFYNQARIVSSKSYVIDKIKPGQILYGEIVLISSKDVFINIKYMINGSSKIKLEHNVSGKMERSSLSYVYIHQSIETEVLNVDANNGIIYLKPSSINIIASNTVVGRINKISEKNVSLDIGYMIQPPFFNKRAINKQKNGVIKTSELVRSYTLTDQEIIAEVIEANDDYLVLSERKHFEQREMDLCAAEWNEWLNVEDESFSGTVVAINEHGFIIGATDEYYKIIVPHDQVPLIENKKLSDFIGETLDLCVVGIDQQTRTVIASGKAWVDLIELNRAKIQPGDILTGIAFLNDRGGLYFNFGWAFPEGVMDKEEIIDNKLPSGVDWEWEVITAIVVTVNDGKGNILLSQKANASLEPRVFKYNFLNRCIEEEVDNL